MAPAGAFEKKSSARASGGAKSVCPPASRPEMSASASPEVSPAVMLAEPLKGITANWLAAAMPSASRNSIRSR